MYFVVREGGPIVLLTDSLYDGFFLKYDSRIYAGRNLLVSSKVFASGHTEKKRITDILKSHVFWPEKSN